MRVRVAFLAAGILLSGCAQAPASRMEEPSTQKKTEAPSKPFEVENWFQAWEGQQPDYPLTNADGEPIVIRGQEAKVGGSHFTFRIQAEGTAQMTQTHADGRNAEFAGKWKGQTAPDSDQLVAIVCDFSAVSTGAYRQYALTVDAAAGVVRCRGTSKEPAFEVRPTAPTPPQQ